MSRFWQILYSVLLWMAIALFALMMVNILVAVGARYLGLQIASVALMEESSRFLFIWVCFLGMPLAASRRVHIRIDLLVQPLPARARLLLEALIQSLTLGLTLFLAYQGMRVAVLASTRSPAMYVPMAWVYAALPLGIAGMALFALRDLLETSSGLLRGGGSTGLTRDSSPAREA